MAFLWFILCYSAIVKKDILITESKKVELLKELDHLKNVVRADISDRVQTARAHGDLSENAEYHSAREAQAKNEGRIGEIEHILKHAKIIERSGSSIAELGAQVRLLKKSTDEKRDYVLVGPEEADMAQGKLSIESPLGGVLVGKKVGDICSVETPKGSTEYEILEIN